MSEQQPTLPDRMLSRRQVAVILGVSTETIKRREKEGRLKGHRFNQRLIRYSAADVQRLIEEAS